MIDENKNFNNNSDESGKKKWLKWSDIRAGKHMKGWPGAPETNGDPYDPNNMERTDAAVIINKGRVLLNLTAMISAKAVSRRRSAIILATGAFWFVVLGSIAWGMKDAEYDTPVSLFSSIQLPKIPSFSSDEREVSFESDGDTKGVQLVQLLEHHYSNSKSGFAQDFDIQNIIARHQAIKNACGRRDLMECYGEMELSDVAQAFAKAAEDKNDYRSSSFYDVVNPNSTLEEALTLSRSGINNALGKPEHGVWGEEQKSRFCANTTRAYLDTRHHSEIAKVISSIKDRWESAADGGIFEVSHLPVANSFSDLVAHKAKKNDDCKINDIVVLPVNSGAIKYLISFAGRSYSHDSGARIGTALYVLAELDDRNVMIKAACNNCGMAGLGDRVNTDRSPLNSIDRSANGVIRVIKKSKLETNISKLGDV